VVIRKHHIPHHFPDDVLRQAESIPTEVAAEEIAKRVDLRDHNQPDGRDDIVVS